MKTKIKNGFTLIELIVVVAIISLIASVILTQLGTSRQKGSDAGKIRTLAEVRNALNVYFNDSTVTGGNGKYPTGSGTVGDLVNIRAALVPKYIPSVDSSIIYYSNGTTYHMGIVLQRNDNTVLKSDSDTSGGFPGLSADCVTAGPTDYCYDVTP